MQMSNNFIPRLYSSGLGADPKDTSNFFNRPIWGDPHYYSWNPMDYWGYGMPNCTTYVWGRFWEISDATNDGSNKPNLPTSHAGTWYPKVTWYEKGQTPRKGAIICWSKPDYPGHVAIVEDVNTSTGDIVISQSGWQEGTSPAKYWDESFFGKRAITKASGYYFGTNYIFQGFIYNPIIPAIAINTGVYIGKEFYLPKIYYGSKWVDAVPYIYKNKKWVETTK